MAFGLIKVKIIFLSVFFFYLKRKFIVQHDVDKLVRFEMKHI